MVPAEVKPRDRVHELFFLGDGGTRATSGAPESAIPSSQNFLTWLPTERRSLFAMRRRASSIGGSILKQKVFRPPPLSRCLPPATSGIIRRNTHHS